MKEIPAAPGQSSLFALTANAPTPTAKVCQLSISFGEPVPTDLLRSTWSAVSAGHGVLRSSFRDTKLGGLLRSEKEAAEASWRDLDWTDVPLPELSSRWTSTLEEEAARPIDLSLAPVLRFVAIRLPNASTHLLVTYPRFLLDEETWFFILCEWIEALEGQRPVESLSKETEEIGNNPEWWQTYLNESKARPLDFFGGGEIPASPIEQALLVDRDTTREIATRCQSLGISSSSALLALWGLLVARLSLGEETILLTATDASDSLGHRTNYLPCRISEPPDMSVNEWLRGFVVAEKLRATKSNQPIQALPAPFNGSTPDAFASVFSWLPPALNDRIPEAFPRWINLDARIINQPLHPLELEVRDGPRLHFRLRASRLPTNESARLLSRFDALVRAFVLNPDASLKDLQIVDSTPQEKPQPDPPTPPACIQDMIADTASEQASTIAVQDSSGASLTYKEVHDYALLLAAYLRNENLGQGWTIGICLSPSLWLPVAILGVLHAGDSFLPLDPKAGEQWLAGHLEAGDAELVLCDSITEPLLAGTGKKTLVVDREWPTISASTLPETPLEAPKIATHFAGTPTIDPPDLRALSPSLLSMACNRSSKVLGFQPNDRITLADPAGTPGFCETILGCLRAGATLVIPADTTPKGLLASNPTHLRLPAHLLGALRKEIAALPPEEPSQIKTLALEVKPTPIKWEALSDWFAAFPSQHRVLQFLSPCGFSGIGLLMEVTDDKSLPTSEGFLGLGKPTRLAGFGFADRSGRIPPPGYPGLVTYKMPFSANQACSDLRIWRDVQGNYFLADIPQAPEEIVSTLPAPQIEQDEQPPESGSIRLSQEELAADSPELAARAIEPEASLAEKSSNAPFASLGGNPDSPALLLFHGLDGSTASFASLLPLLTPDWEVFGTFAPTRERRDFDSEVNRIESLLLQHWKNTPIHLLGIGYGGLLAFEVTTRLRAAGIDVPCLLIAGTPAPGQIRGGWLGKLKRGFASVQGQSPEADSILELAESLRPNAISGRAGIILTSDSPDDSEQRWLGLIPDATFENARGTLQELLSSRTAEFLRSVKALSGT